MIFDQVAGLKAWTVPVGENRQSARMNARSMTLGFVSVLLHDRHGRSHVGHGFTGTGRYSHASVVNDRLANRILSAEPSSLCDEYGELDPVACESKYLSNEKMGGHGERAAAAAGLSMAIWDAYAKSRDLPLHRAIGSYYGVDAVADEVKVYVGTGYYGPDRSHLLEEMEHLNGMGIEKVKIKVGQLAVAEELRRLETVFKVYDPRSVAVDANGALQPSQARELMSSLASFGLAWFEDPFDPAEFYELKMFVAETETAVATGEEILGFSEFRNLLRYAGLRPDRDFLTVDPAVAYGVHEYKRMIRLAESFGWSATSFMPHGGHLFSLHMSAAFGCGMSEYYPYSHRPVGGFGCVSVCDGKVDLPESPGLGLENLVAMQPHLARFDHG